MIEMKVSRKGLSRIQDFCREVHRKRSTRDRLNNDTGSHRLNREITGKIGEACVALKLDLWDKFDLNIYETGNVRFNGDLGDHIHVKTCHIQYKDSRFDSWLMDRNDQVFLSPNEDDLIYLAYANEEGICQILGYVKAVDVNTFWKDSIKLPHKVAIYRKDVEDLITEMF